MSETEKTIAPEEESHFAELYEMCKAEFPDMDDWVIRGLVLMHIRNELPELEEDENQKALQKKFKIEPAVEQEPESQMTS